MRSPALLALFALALPLHAAVELKEGKETVAITVGGKPFTEYHFTGAPHVYFYPLLGPGGARMTRDWPMQDTPGEEHDHFHHRSLWFAHGEVNGIDFWTEQATYKPDKPPKNPLGQIVHEKFLKVEGGAKEGTLSSLNKWVAPDGTVPLTSVQTVRFYDTGTEEKMFDFEVTLTAGEKDATMADSKEGAMAMRLAESMRLRAGKGQPAAQGHILNSEGQKDGEVWGKEAKWVDYWGPVNGQTVGVAIFDHPSNFGTPPRWHARDYGLFAANPFCEHDMNKTAPDHAGDVVIKAGQSLTFKYRFILHEGDATQAKIAERFAEYATK